MAVATLAERIDAPADAVWSFVCWHGVAKLEQYSGGFFRKIEFQGDTPAVGITKTIYPHEGLPIHERLEWLDAADRSYRYRLTDVGSLPITDYRGYVRVTPAGPDACHLKIECEYDAVEVTDAQWAETWLAMETQLVNEIRQALLKG
ncbi:SRPBCC family protein [Sphingomonas colocasiae]|uniref:SRPBCC family protein n=1 Tax=Sphingomonas colocasiae TaxID=1848973 RepID=A0ABS7Q0D9_9SPHN|nr:SRPBCC family protein [Sphingomonas colocasiae]MBY8826350.1 SRPBCC family protein [Sphingomonas colocasiae]